MKKSKLNAALKEELLLVNKKMPRRARLDAFFTHSQLLTRLVEAGENYRKRNRNRKILLTSARKKSNES